MVCAINPSLDLHTDSSELLRLQQVSSATCSELWVVIHLLFFNLPEQNTTFSVTRAASGSGGVSLAAVKSLPQLSQW